MNPNAKPFSFNPNASSFNFTPAGTAPPPGAAGGISNRPAIERAANEAPAPVISISTSRPAPVISISTKKAEAPAPVISISTKKPEAAAPAPVISISTKKAEPAPAPAPAAAAPEVKQSWDDEDVEDVSKKTAKLSVETTKVATPVTPATPIATSPAAEPASAPVPSASPAPSPTAAPAAAPTPAPKKEVEYKYHDEREPVNLVFIGHVDAGKSTISGQVLLLTDQVDKRTMEKYEKEAKEKNRDSWYLAYVMDTNEEERAKGKTVEVGRAHFASKNKRYTLLDAPGHKLYVPNMIGGTAQADIGILVISARKGEFETGFDKGGQTREHAMLAKSLGVRRLVVMVNKMDEQTVNWSKERYDEIEGKLTPFLKQWGYSSKEVSYIPVSGYTGHNLKELVPESVCSWYKGPPFFTLLDQLPPIERDASAPLRIPIVTRFKDMGVLYVVGKVESGTVTKESEMLLMPNNKRVTCHGLLIDEEEVNIARPGENIVMRVKGVEEEEIQAGFVLSSIENPVKRSKEIEAQLAILPLLEHKPIMTAGYKCVLHIHSLAMEAQITQLLSEVDKKTGKPTKKRPVFCKGGQIITCKIHTHETIAVETFKEYPALGRFTLRDEGRTIGFGKILKIKEYSK